MAALPFSRDPKSKGEREGTVPGSNPFTPPDSTGICPRCGERSNFANPALSTRAHPTGRIAIGRYLRRSPGSVEPHPGT